MYNVLLIIGLLIGVMHHTTPETVEEKFDVSKVFSILDDNVAGSCSKEFAGVHFNGEQRRQDLQWDCTFKDMNFTLEWMTSCVPVRFHQLTSLTPTAKELIQQGLSTLKLAYDEIYYNLNVHKSSLVRGSSEIAYQRAVVTMDFLIRQVESSLLHEVPAGNKLAALCIHKWVWTSGPLSSVMKNAP